MLAILINEKGGEQKRLDFDKPVDLQGRRFADCLHAALDRGKGPAPVT